MAFPTFKPALRIVNSTGGVLAGPQILYQPNSQGLFCDTSCEYVPEFLGPWMNLSYSTRWRLLGYRPLVSLHFALATVDGASGFANLFQYYVAGVASETYAALQFNLYSASSSVWRGMTVTTSWAPKPARGKQRAGFEMDMTLEARDLISAPGDWSSSVW